MLKLSPAIMETSRPASLPSRCDSGQMRITELLTERISDTQRTHTTLAVLIPLISGFIRVFLIPPFNCCSCLIRTPGRISASIISCFSSLSWTDRLSEESICQWCLTWLVFWLVLTCVWSIFDSVAFRGFMSLFLEQCCQR